MLQQEERAARDAAIQQFVDQYAPGEHGDLYANMLTTVCRLAHDDCSRGDLKLVSAALAELRYAFKIFAPYRMTRKISIFGSARTPDDHPDFIQALKFAERMRMEDWMVITGAGDGIMKAGHGGAGKEKSFGVAIRLPFEQRTNTFIENDPKLVNFKYFFTRKLMFIKEASAVALFPGGFGTQDEGFEALTLVQTGKAAMVPIVMVDAPRGTYWQHWRTYVQSELLRTGMIGADDMNLFHITDDVESAVRNVVQFFRRYHSSRYIRDQLVLRMTEPISALKLERLNDLYKDIIKSGKITVAEPAAEEADDHPELARITLDFNRRSHGRLRLMIDDINNGDA